jgi:hypothetical protein
VQDHSYEEIRQAAIDVLAGREKAAMQSIQILDEPSQYDELRNAVAAVFDYREGGRDRIVAVRHTMQYRTIALSPDDAERFLEVFWGLFRDGTITLGLNDAYREFPYFKVSEFGRRLIRNQDPYRFHDVETYEMLVKKQVPDVDEVTLVYLREAMQSFMSGSVMAASVMLGVATEHSFLKLLETIDANQSHRATFKKANEERTLLRKLNKFKNVLDQNLSILPNDAKEDLDTNFLGIVSMIRTFRNESGHPSGQIIGREQCFVLLQLFVPCCKKIYRLIDVFR